MNSSRVCVAYLCHEYPKLTETFVYREIEVVRALGMNVAVFAMKKPSDVEKIECGRELVSKAYYLPPDFSFPFLTAQIRQFMKNPLRYFSILLKLLSVGGRKSAMRLVVRIGFFLRGALLADLLQKRKDILLLHCPYTGDEIVCAHTASRLSGVPLSFTLHAPFHLYKGSPLLKRQALDAVFISAISEDARNRLIDLAGENIEEKIKVIHCGIDTPAIRIAGKPTKSNKIVSAGSLVKIKGHDILIRAVKLLVQEGYVLECEIIGEGPQRKKLEKLINELGVNDIVRLAGAKPQTYVYNALKESAIFVLSSRVDEEGDRDGVPVVLMEAMASGRPCVSTKVSGIPELVIDGKTGILVEQDNPHELAQAIRKILENHQLAENMGKAGRERVEKAFSLDKQARLMREEFERALTAIAYISHEFPKITETFIKREVEALRKNGMIVKVFSYRSPRNMKSDKHTLYLPSFTSLDFWWGVIESVIDSPLLSLKVLAKTLKAGLRKEMRARRLGYMVDALRGFWIANKCRGKVSAFHGSFATISATSAWSAGMITSKPFGFSSHSSPPDALLEEKCEKADWIFSESEFDRSYISELGGKELAEKIEVVRCGIDPLEWEEADWESQRWATGPALFVGTLGPKKGVLTLMKAVIEVVKRRLDFKLDVVGDGPLRGKMLDILRMEGCERFVEFHGELSFTELKKLYYKSRFFVLPAEITPEGDRDGIPVSLMEAMASGMPCISTEVSGIPELVKDGVNGFLIPPGEFILLKDAMLKLWDDVGLCVTMGKKAREMVFEKHDLEKNTKLFVSTVKNKLVERK